jgi:hypothetical protein
LIDSSEEDLGRQITAFFTTQRALHDDRLKRKFGHAGRDVSAAFLAVDDERLAS